jgi:hypothetical protein
VQTVLDDFDAGALEKARCIGYLASGEMRGRLFTAAVTEGGALRLDHLDFLETFSVHFVEFSVGQSAVVGVLHIDPEVRLMNEMAVKDVNEALRWLSPGLSP